MSENRNVYLDQVMAQQERLEQDLRSKRSASAPAAVAPAGGIPAQRGRGSGRDAGASAPAPSAVDVRVSGFWRWKTVLVPPNAFVVHTRRGRTEPLHVGLGTSFRFDPSRDSYLVVPGAMHSEATTVASVRVTARSSDGLMASFSDGQSRSTPAL